MFPIVPENAAPAEAHGRIRRAVADWFGRQLRRLKFRPFVLLLLLLLGWVLLPHVVSETLRIDAMVVPKRYEEAGWTGEALSRRIRQEILQLDQLARGSGDSLRMSVTDLPLRVPTNTPAIANVEVPETGASLATFVEVLREALNRPSPRVEGEVVLPVGVDAAGGAPAELTIRIADARTYTVLPPIVGSDPQALARCAAQRILHLRNPSIFAFVLYHARQLGDARRQVSRLVNDPIWSKGQSDSARSEAFNLLGNILLQENDYAGAMTQYTESIRLDPRNMSPYVNEAMAHHHRFRSVHERAEGEAAIRMYKRALVLNPGSRLNDNVYLNMGLAYQDLGQLDAAVNAYERAHRLNPRNTNVLIALGVTYGMRGKLTEAIARFQQAFAIDDKNANVLINWGYALGLDKKYQQAYQKFQDAEILEPTNAAIYRNWAEVLELEQETARAAEKKAVAAKLATPGRGHRPQLACAVQW